MKTRILSVVLAVGVSAFAGIDGALRIGDNVSDTTSAAVSTEAQITTTKFVVELWVKPTTFHKEDHFFSQDLSGNAGRLMLCLVNGKPRFQIGGTQLNYSQAIPLNEWTHLAFRRATDGGEMLLYVNGVPYAKTATNATAIANTSIVLGKLKRNTQTFTGEMAEVRVWKADRNNSTIKANFTRRMKGTESNLAFCWPMDEGSGATCRELVANKAATIVKTDVVDWSDSMLPFVLSKQTLTGDRTDTLTILDGTLIAPVASDYKLSGGYKMNARNSGAAVLRVETGANLTVEGAVTVADSSSGGFVKTGAGTLVYSGAGDVCLAAHTQNSESEVDIDARGIGPTTGYHCGAVADGTLVIDKPGQTVSVAVNGTGRFITGVMYKENDARTAGHVIVSNGTFNCGIVGLNYLGSWTSSPSDPSSTFTVEGGVVNSTGALRLGKANGIFNMNGGTFINPASQAPYFVGGCNIPGVVRTVNLNGGRFVAGDFTCGSGATGSTDVLNFNGGIFEANNAVEQDLANDNGYKSYISRGGAKFDCSKISERLSLSLKLEHDPALGEEVDGGLTVLGGTLVYRSKNSTYTGDTVVESGAILAVSPNSGTAIPGRTVVRNGARLHPNDYHATAGLNTAGLLVEDGGILSLPVNTATGMNGYVAVTGGSPVFGAGYVEFVDGIYGTTHYIANGTFRVATYTGTTPDVSRLQVYELPEGRKATFAAADGVVTVTIAADYGAAAEWTKDGDGDFSDSANWNKTLASGCDVTFGAAITADRTVTTAGETVGVMGFNNADASYTLDGTGIAVNGRLAVDAGEHVISAPLTLGGAVESVLAPGTKLTVGELAGDDGSLMVSGGGTFAMTDVPAKPVTLDSATLDVPNGANWNLSNVTIPADKTGTIGCSGGSATVSGIQGAGTLRSSGCVRVTDVGNFSGVEVMDGTLSLAALPLSLTLNKAVLAYSGVAGEYPMEALLQPRQGNAAVIRTDVDLELTGRLDVDSGAFIKQGTGNLTLNNPLTKEATIGCSQNLGPANGEPVFFDFAAAAEGRAPVYGFMACTVEAGTLTLGSGGFVVNNSTVGVGSSTVPNGQSEKSANFVVNGATLKRIDQLQVGLYNYTTDPNAEAPASKFIVSNGTVNVSQLYLGHAKTNVVGRTKPFVVMEGGTMTVEKNFQFGAWSYAPSDDSVGSLIVNGGTLNLPNFNFGNRLPSNGNQMRTYFELNGGTVVVTNEIIIGNCQSRAELHLNGGTLEAWRIASSGNTSREFLSGTVYFNGTTFVATKDDVLMNTSTLTEGGFYMQAGGLTVDLSKLGAGKKFGFNTAIVRDPALGTMQDGGLTIKGPSDRVFDVASKNLLISGPICLEGGYCAIMPRMTNDVYVAAGANLTMRDLATGSVGDFTGAGTVTNTLTTGVLNIYGKFHSQGATIGNLAVKSGAKLVSDGKDGAVAKALLSATIETGVVYDFKDALPALNTTFPILDVSAVDAAKISYPRALKVAVNGAAADACFRVVLSVEDGILKGTLVANGMVIIIR